MQNKPNFPKTKIATTSFSHTTYENSFTSGRPKNKPKQSQFQTQSDHINHNGLDNRKSNLRICTMQQNSWNMRKQKGNCTSQYKGVTWRKDASKWQVRITYNAKKISLGFFDEKRRLRWLMIKKQKSCSENLQRLTCHSPKVGRAFFLTDKFSSAGEVGRI